MHAVSCFSLESHTGPYAEWPTHTRLRMNGVESGQHIAGYVIEAQYQFAGGYLLITSYDCPFEESTSFILLNNALQIQATRHLMAPYQTFLLHAHWPIDEHTLALHYHETLFYTLHIVPPWLKWRKRPRLRLKHRLLWRADAQMAQSHQQLQARLDQIQLNAAPLSR